jgi:TM2 domain-containing membrane protein YozV
LQHLISYSGDNQAMKNKTLAVWLTLLAGPLGLHRLYLYRRYGAAGWLLLLASLVGVYGVLRARQLGVDDQLSWLLIPFLGFALAGCTLQAIVYGLTDTEKWNQRFNPALPLDAPAGHTQWLTVAGLVTSLFLGTTVLMASVAFSFQRYFEFQMEQAVSAPNHQQKNLK